MVEWLLVLAFYSGAMSKTDSVALTTVAPFQNQQECIDAGNQLKSFETMMKAVNFSCVKRTTGRPQSSYKGNL